MISVFRRNLWFAIYLVPVDEIVDLLRIKAQRRPRRLVLWIGHCVRLHNAIGGMKMSKKFTRRENCREHSGSAESRRNTPKKSVRIFGLPRVFRFLAGNDRVHLGQSH